MDTWLMWLAFIGSWMLVGGPLYQGSLELLELDIDREGIEKATAGLVPPPTPSPWWWLLPPVILFKRYQNSKNMHELAEAMMTEEQLQQFIGFRHKATGWFTVSAGAFFLALRETWELVEHYEWSEWIFWALTLFLLGSALGNTVRGNQRFERNNQARRGPGNNKASRNPRGRQRE